MDDSIDTRPEPRATRLVLAAALLALGLGAAVYPAWRAGEAAGAAHAASAGIDWVRALEQVPDAAFEPPRGPWTLALPGDHGAHADARTESWVLSGLVSTAAGERIAFELALLRVALVAPDAPARASAWATREVYRAHFTVAPENGPHARGEERFSRAAVGLAGDEPANGRLRLHDWVLGYAEPATSGRLSLAASLPGVRLEAVAEPARAPVVLAGDGSRAPLRGYAIPRLAISGTLSRDAEATPVAGQAWLEHLWGEVPLPIGPIAWDRLRVWLDDGTEVSALRTRRRDGGGTPRASGFRTGPSGDLVPLAADAVRLEPAGRPWTDPRSGVRYPLAWRLAAGDLRLEAVPWLEAQAHEFGVPAWSGAVAVRGRAGSRDVTGTGILTLTGYGPAR